MFEIKVYGMDLADVESIGGWQTYEKTTKEAYARDLYEMLVTAHGEDNVAYYIDGELVEYDWDVIDDAEMNMPCDTYGMCACSSSCPRYYQCQA